MPYRKTGPVVQVTVSATAASATLTGQATELIITLKASSSAVDARYGAYALLAATTTVTASTGLFIPFGVEYHMYPAPGDTRVDFLECGTANKTAYVQQIY